MKRGKVKGIKIKEEQNDNRIPRINIRVSGLGIRNFHKEAQRDLFEK